MSSLVPHGNTSCTKDTNTCGTCVYWSGRRNVLGELVEYFTANEPRGEIVIIVAGSPPVETTKVDKYAAFKGKKARV